MSEGEARKEKTDLRERFAMCGLTRMEHDTNSSRMRAAGK